MYARRRGFRRFEGEEEEWRGGEEERKIVMASWRGYEKARGEGEGAERTRVLSSDAHTGASRMRQVLAIGGEWWDGAQRAWPRYPAGWARS